MSEEPSAADLAALRAACGDDAARLRRRLKRLRMGEPLAYVLGRLEFRGLSFRVDRRAYVTDTELTHLVDAVARAGRDLPPGSVVAEIGVGCGSLATCVARALPQTRLVGLDLDPGALALAAENARAHGAAVELLESDFFMDWGKRPEPALIYGDLPWGDDSTLYEGRSFRHYLAMPPASAFPLGGRTGAHEELLAGVAERGWRSLLLLNCGSLPEDDLGRLARASTDAEVLRPAEGVSILRCRPGRSTRHG